MALIAKANTGFANASKDDDLKRFSTYLNYLENISDFIHSEYGDPDNFGDIIVKETKRFRTLSGLELTKLEKWLKLSWNTEYLLYVSCEDKDDEILRFTNPWIPVLTYYSIYSCLIALCYSYDKSVPNTHGGTLKIATNLLVDKGIPPWNLAYEGPPGRKDQDHMPKNFPDNIDLNELPSNLSTIHTEPIRMIATCLRAEHINRKEDIWKSGYDGRKYDIDPKYTGIFHFLYRLRRKSNYEDMDFTTIASNNAIKDFTINLEEICYCTLMYMEAIILRRCGKDNFLGIAKKYLNKNKDATQLKDRISIYKEKID